MSSASAASGITPTDALGQATCGGGLLGSVCGQWRPAGGLTLTAIKPTSNLSAGAAMNVSEGWDSCHPHSRAVLIINSDGACSESRVAPPHGV